MNILDIGIIIFILLGAVMGFVRGFTKEIVKTIGIIAVIVLAYMFKNPLSVFLYEKLPFLSLGLLKNAAILNVLIYELLAFILCLIAFAIILRILIHVSSFIEKIFDATVILSIPSKIAGAFVGIVCHYVIAFIILYVLSIAFIDNNIVYSSSFRPKMLNNTPILSGYIDKGVNVASEFRTLMQNYNDKNISENDFNYQAFELFLKYDVIKVKSLDKLLNDGKVQFFPGCGELLDRYRED